MDKSAITSLAIGHFDGIHLGHMEIFKHLDKNGGILVIENSLKKLTPVREKFINLPIFYKNISKIKHLSGDEFIKSIKNEFANLKLIVVGYDFKFGHKRKCDVSDLRIFFDGDVFVVDEFRKNSLSVHSSDIKRFLRYGDIKKSNFLLGRLFCIFGKVVKGQGIGKDRLFATLNLETQDQILPKNGVYATIIKVNGRNYDSITFLGKRYSTDLKFSIETHIIEPFFKQNVEDVELFFVDFIRENQKFFDLNDLKMQISKDILISKKILKEYYEG